MSLLNPSWSWDSASASSSSSTPLTSTQSSPKSMQCPTLLSLNPSTHSTPCPDTASGSNAFASSVPSACSIASTSTSTTSSSASSSSSTSSTSSTSTLQPSSSSQSQPYKSKSDAFFSFHSSMEPIKPPSPIFSRRASDSCLPPPCAVPPPSLTRSNAKASSSSSKGNSLRERFSSLPDIHERGIAPSSCSSSSNECASNTGLGIRSPPSHQLSSTSTLSSSLLAYSSTSSSSHSSGSSSPSASQRRSHSRQSSIEDIEARLSLAIANLSESNSSSDADADGDNDDDMYNDTPSCSSSQKRNMKAPKKSRRKEKSSSSSLSVFEEDEASDEDENGGTTIRIHLASGPTMRERGMRQVNAYEEDEEEEDDSPFIPCYPLTPLETIYKPLHRIRRNRSLRRALSDSCATGALQSSPSTHERKVKSSLRTGGKGENERRVSFCNEVKVVDVFAAVDYPARRGPPPLERLTMRDVLELRQIKLELAAYMGEEYPSPEIASSSKAIPSGNLFPPSQGTAMASSSSLLEIEHREEASMPTTPALEASPILEQASILECTARPIAFTSSDGPASAFALNGKGVSTAKMSSKTQLGPGMEIDLHSLIAPPCSLGSFTTSSSSTNTTVIIEDQIATSQKSPSPSSSSLPASTLSGYSSPNSGTSLSSESGLNSLSCSPATSDSEFGSGEGCSSGTSTYDDTPTSSRRGSDDTSGDEDDVDVDADCHNGRNQVDSAEKMLDSGRTPTKLSLLRHGQFDNRPSIASSIRKRSLLNSDSNDKKMEIGRIQIALPAMAGDRFASSTTFDLSPMSTAAANDPWNPSTF